MDFDKLFDDNYDISIENIEMDKDKYLIKTNEIFSILDNEYAKSWIKVRLSDFEYPEQSVCDKCTGCGTTIVNREEVECIADREEGECHYVMFDAEEFGIRVGEVMNSIWDLLPVNKLK